MATYTKEFLSNSSNGRPILVAGTNTGTATSIHFTSTSNTNIDEVWLYGVNTNVDTQILYIEFGSNTSPNDLIPITMKPNDGLYVCIPGLPLRGTGTATSNIKAYASTANVISVTGYVNRIEP